MSIYFTKEAIIKELKMINRVIVGLFGLWVVSLPVGVGLTVGLSEFGIISHAAPFIWLGVWLGSAFIVLYTTIFSILGYLTVRYVFTGRGFDV